MNCEPQYINTTRVTTPGCDCDDDIQLIKNRLVVLESTSAGQGNLKSYMSGFTDTTAVNVIKAMHLIDTVLNVELRDLNGDIFYGSENINPFTQDVLIRFNHLQSGTITIYGE